MASVQNPQFNPAGYVVSVRHDSNVHRYMYCQRCDTADGSFSITTWPNHLAISGDMGCYVFSRVFDMFPFFNVQRSDFEYLRSKLEAQDVHSPALEFSHKAFVSRLQDMVTEYTDAGELTSGQQEELQELLDSSEIGQTCNECLARVAEISEDITMNWEGACMEIVPRFQWACEAIHWAVTNYYSQLAEQRQRLVMQIHQLVAG